MIQFFHEGTLKENEKQGLEELKRYSQEGEKSYNYIVEERDLSEDSGEENFYQEIGKYKLPFIILLYPGSAERNPAWSGSMSGGMLEEALKSPDNTYISSSFILHPSSLFNSPAREEISNRLNSGETAVWVLVKSGNAEKDQKALATLEQELFLLEKTPLTPDRSTPVGSSSGLKDAENGNLKIVFSLLGISRQDPKERIFTSLLLSSEPDLKDYSAEPIVFPVYARGKILYALAGQGITEYNIRKSAEFLTGSCSCLVKDSYPGTDILMSTDWKSFPPSQENGKSSQQFPTSLGSLIPAEEIKNPSDHEEASESPNPGGSETIRSEPGFAFMIILSFFIVVTTVLILFFIIRKRKVFQAMFNICHFHVQ